MIEKIQNIYDWLKLSGHTFYNRENVPLAISLVDEEVLELKEAIESNNRFEVIDALEDIFWMCQNVAFFYGITPQELEDHSKKVFESNYSKFPQTKEEAETSVEMYRSGTHSSKLGTRIDTYYEETGNEHYPYVIKRHDGKVLKSYLYKNLVE